MKPFPGAEPSVYEALPNRDELYSKIKTEEPPKDGIQTKYLYPYNRVCFFFFFFDRG